MHLFVCINNIMVWAISLQYQHMILLDKELIQNFVVKVEQPKDKLKIHFFFSYIIQLTDILNFRYKKN